LGIGSVMALVKKWRDDQKVSQKELQDLLLVHSRELKDHVTASRAQTIRYIDRKTDGLVAGHQTLVKNQEAMLEMLVDVESKMTKRANSKTKVLFPVETRKGNA